MRHLPCPSFVCTVCLVFVAPTVSVCHSHTLTVSSLFPALTSGAAPLAVIRFPLCLLMDSECLLASLQISGDRQWQGNRRASAKLNFYEVRRAFSLWKSLLNSTFTASGNPIIGSLFLCMQESVCVECLKKYSTVADQARQIGIGNDFVGSGWYAPSHCVYGAACPEAIRDTAMRPPYLLLSYSSNLIEHIENTVFFFYSPILHFGFLFRGMIGKRNNTVLKW